MRRVTSALMSAVQTVDRSDKQIVAKLAALVSWTENYERHVDERADEMVVAVNGERIAQKAELMNLRSELAALMAELMGSTGSVVSLKGVQGEGEAVSEVPTEMREVMQENSRNVELMMAGRETA